VTYITQLSLISLTDRIAMLFIDKVNFA